MRGVSAAFAVEFRFLLECEIALFVGPLLDVEEFLDGSGVAGHGCLHRGGDAGGQVREFFVELGQIDRRHIGGDDVVAGHWSGCLGESSSHRVEHALGLVDLRLGTAGGCLLRRFFRCRVWHGTELGFGKLGELVVGGKTPPGDISQCDGRCCVEDAAIIGRLSLDALLVGGGDVLFRCLIGGVEEDGVRARAVREAGLVLP